MKLNVERYLRSIYIISSARNKLISCLCRFLCGQSLSIDVRGLKIFHPEGISIGDNFSAGQGLWLESVNGRGKLTIGNNVNFSDSVHIACAQSIHIGNGALFGSKVLVSDHSHGQRPSKLNSSWDCPPNERKIYSSGSVRIEDNVWLGDGVCVLSNVCIGYGAIIGANSVVVNDVPAKTVWAGAPARQIWPKL